MTPGDVIYWPNYQFPDGGDADKLFIIANIQRSNQQILLKTTSRSNRYRPEKEGCHHTHGYYSIPQGRSWFNLHTWVVLHDPIVCSASDLEEYCQNGRIKQKTSLNDQLLRAIINCFKKTQDCSPHHLWLLED